MYMYITVLEVFLHMKKHAYFNCAFLQKLNVSWLIACGSGEIEVLCCEIKYDFK